MSLYDKIIAVYNKIRGRIDGHFPVQTADIADGAVVNAKLGNEAVSGEKIQDKTITRGKNRRFGGGLHADCGEQ